MVSSMITILSFPITFIYSLYYAVLWYWQVYLLERAMDKARKQVGNSMLPVLKE